LLVPSLILAPIVGSDFKRLDGGRAIVVVVMLRGPLLVSAASGAPFGAGLS
jgi:hypothetical protein